MHVNVGLVLKFMPNYMLNPKEYPEIPMRNDSADDTFFWNQGRRGVRARCSSPTGH